jgi:peptide/nickel transport system substrate-binding protein
MTSKYGGELGVTAWQPLPPSAFGYDPELEGHYPYDPQKARDLLAEAGYPDGGVPVHFLIGSQATSAVQQLEVVHQMMNEAGFAVEIDLADLPAVLPRILGNRTDNCGTVNGGFTLVKLSSIDPDVVLRQRFLEDGPLNAGCNEPSWIRPLIDQAAVETDDEARAEIYAEISKRIVEEGLDGVPLYYSPAITAMQPYVGGVERAATNNSAYFHGVYITEGRVDAPPPDDA